MPSPLDCFRVNIARWEGMYQAMPGDPGNWIGGRLVGTMRGVTPAVLAAHRRIPAGEITADTMRSVTLTEAAEIGLRRFYTGTGLDRLEWGPATDALVDFGWGSGPGQAVKSCERVLGINAPDFKVGDDTVRLWAEAVAREGWQGWTRAICRMRQDFYDLICRLNGDLQQFRAGWRNRADWMLPGTEWWAHWQDGDTDSAVHVADAMISQPLPARLLSLGSQGADVAELQRTLNEKADALLDVDGIFGSTTMLAVRHFQQARHLDIDGWVGPATRAALGLA